MINVNQITSQLAKMPDQALQQYAAMHKNDPYTVSLALSEFKRRQQMRARHAAPATRRQSRKVVDQVVAGMSPQPQMPQGRGRGRAQAMPEDTGIAQLPAGNMNFAEGGIISFAGGGEVQRFDAGGAVDAARAQRQAAQQTLYGYGLRQRRDDPQGFADAQANLEAATVATNAAEQAYQTEMSRSGMGAAMNRSSIGATGQFGPPTAQGPSMTAAPAVNVAAPVVPPAPAAPPNVPPADTTLGAKTPPPPRADDGIKTLLAPRAPAAAPTPPAKDFMTLQREMEDRYGGAVDPLEERRRSTTEMDVKGRREGLAQLQADQESDMSTMFKGRDERAAKREGELEKSKETNTGMAFLEAGLAMMQSKGRGLAGIAQGAGVGTKAYAAGIDKIKTAQEKLDEARDRTEELRQNQSSMNKREVRAEERGIRDTLVAGERDITAGMAQAMGETRADVRSAVTSRMNVDAADQNRQFQAGENVLNRANAVTTSKITAAGKSNRLDMAEERLKMDALKARADILKDRIRNTPKLADRAKLQSQLADIDRQLAGGTIGTPSAAPAPGGAKFLGFE